MNLNEIIKMRGIVRSKKIKLVRHLDPKVDTRYLYKNGMLEYYQSLQSSDVFRDCDYVLAFLGEDGLKATFIGAYEKLSSTIFDATIHHPPAQFPYMEILNQPLFRYEFRKLAELDDLIDRLVIDWETRGWHQWLKDEKPKKVVEILPPGYVKEFPGFDELILTYDELAAIVKNEDANRNWHTMLSSVAGIYLIVDMTDGSQYVGSASGEYGLMGRWKSYVAQPHGGNDRLKKILLTEPDRYKHFQFSILRTLSKSLTKSQVVAHEQKYKQKLGSRAFGLNGN